MSDKEIVRMEKIKFFNRPLSKREVEYMWELDSMTDKEVVKEMIAGVEEWKQEHLTAEVQWRRENE